MKQREWRLVRPGVRLNGQWTPDIFDYPFRYEGPQVGDMVYVIVRNRSTKEFKVDRDYIVDVSDAYDWALRKTEDKREHYLMDYWIDTYNPGHGLTFGDVLFERRVDAQEILNDILANLDKWDAGVAQE